MFEDEIIQDFNNDCKNNHLKITCNNVNDNNIAWDKFPSSDSNGADLFY